MSEPIRVLVVFPDGQPGPSQRTVLALAPPLARRKIEIVACFLGDGPLGAHCRDTMGLQTLFVPAAGRRSLGRAIELVIRNTRVDLVHSISASVHAVAGAAARRAGVRCVWSQIDLPARRNLREVHAALVGARAILVPSAVVAARQRRLNPRRVPLLFTPPGLPRPQERYAARRDRARGTLGLRTGALAVGWLVAAGSGTEVDVAVRAAASVCHARPRVRLVVIPDPVQTEPARFGAALADRAAAAGIGARLTMVASHDRPDPPPVLAGLDLVFIASEREEATALPAIEALGAGVPFVGVDRSPLRECVKPGLTGLLVPPGDAEALAAALLSLADAPDQRDRLGRAALRSARELFDSETVAKQVAEIYRAAAHT